MHLSDQLLGGWGPPNEPRLERRIAGLRRGARVGSTFRHTVTRLSFRARLFLALFAVSAIPVALISVAGIVYVRITRLAQGTGNLSDLGRTWQTARAELARVPLSEGARLAVERHDTTLNFVIVSSTRQKYMAQLLTDKGPIVYAFAGLILLLGVSVVGITLSRQFSSPLDEVVDWTDRIRRHEPLPDEAAARGIPEFAALQSALRELQRGLEQARLAELESERLRAFGEVARRVAHEMKNPLTPIRLAVLQLSRNATPDVREVLDVIAVESSRLEAMAREFAELGRLPEGIAAPVDLGELLTDLLTSTVPPGMTHRLTAAPDVPVIDGYYDPLRRAFSNVLRNAVEACRGSGTILVDLRAREGMIELQISDDGPGIPLDKREQIFQPYYTEKGDGTGLGQHRGNIAVTDTPGGGATFLVRFPV